MYLEYILELAACKERRIRRYRQTERQFLVVQFPYSALSRLRLYYNFPIQSQTGLDNDPFRVSFSKGILGKSLVSPAELYTFFAYIIWRGETYPRCRTKNYNISALKVSYDFRLCRLRYCIHHKSFFYKLSLRNNIIDRNQLNG